MNSLPTDLLNIIIDYKDDLERMERIKPVHIQLLERVKELNTQIYYIYNYYTEYEICNALDIGCNFNEGWEEIITDSLLKDGNDCYRIYEGQWLNVENGWIKRRNTHIGG